MANTFTDLIPDMYEALDVVSRELSGLIPSVTMNSNLEEAGLDDSIRVPITQAQTSANNTSAVTPPDTGDQTIDNVVITIDNSKHVPIRWNGEQTKSYSNNGTFSSTFAQQVAQGMRQLVNEIETDIANEYVSASRAFGASGTTPFATSLTEAAEVGKILDDNGCPKGDRHLVVDTTAGVNLRSLTNLTQVNAAGSDGTLREGLLLPLMGFTIRESAQIATHTAGTGASGTTDNAGYAVGATTITLASAGTGTVVSGDHVTITGDTNKYIVQTGDSDISDGGTMVLNKPGLRAAIAASATAFTLGAAYTANLAFHRSAIQLVTRMPALPNGGDMATNTQRLVDPNTGLVFEIAEYKQFLQTSYHVRVAWGVKLIKPEHCAILLG